MAEARPRRLLATLLARFDGAVLRVAPPGRPSPSLGMPSAAQRTQWAPLQSWCLQGAEGGRSSQIKLSVAVWNAEPSSPQEVLVEAFSRHLDGSHQLLAAGGAFAGLWLRLWVKACDVAWWRPRHSTDPWDCGYVVDEPAVREALVRFSPRRATFMVALNWPEPALREVVKQLAQSSAQWVHPVRWLVVQRRNPSQGAPACLAGLPVERLQPLDTER